MEKYIITEKQVKGIKDNLKVRASINIIKILKKVETQKLETEFKEEELAEISKEMFKDGDVA